MKHVIAAVASLIGYYLIIRLTEINYFSGVNLGYFGTAKALMAMHEPYFYFLLLMNYFIKPLMIYVCVIMLFSLIKKR